MLFRLHSTALESYYDCFMVWFASVTRSLVGMTGSSQCLSFEDHLHHALPDKMQLPCCECRHRVNDTAWHNSSSTVEDHV